MRKKHVDELAKNITFLEDVAKIKLETGMVEKNVVQYMYWNYDRPKVLKVLEFLQPDMLVDEYSKDVLKAMKDALLSGGTIDDVIVNLIRGGKNYHTDLAQSLDQSVIVNVEAQINYLLDTQAKLHAIYETQRVILGEKNLNDMIMSLIERSQQLSQKFHDNEHLANTFFDENESLSTGLQNLDDITGGIGMGHLWLVSGYTSVGKTMFLVTLLHNIISQGKFGLFFSLEMTDRDIFGRLVAKDSGVNIRKARQDMKSPDAKKVRESIARVKDMPFKIYQDKRGLDDILLAIQKESQTQKIDCIFLDYAQLISTHLTKEYENMTRVAQRLQDFCKTMNIPIVLLSQISNENARTPDDKMIGAKGGGSLPASADVAIEIYSEMTADDIASRNIAGDPYQVTCRIKKNRHGRTGKVTMDAYAWKSCFVENSQAGLENLSPIPVRPALKFYENLT